MTREEKIARAHGLRYVGGLSLRTIADELDVSLNTVQRWLDPDRIRAQNRLAKENRTIRRRNMAGNAFDRARIIDSLQREYDRAKTMCSCGRQMDKRSTQCLICYRSSKNVEPNDEAVVEIFPKALQDRFEMDNAIYEAWHQGLDNGSSLIEIAFSLGITREDLMTRVACMRRAGRDLPHAIKRAS